VHDWLSDQLGAVTMNKPTTVLWGDRYIEERWDKKPGFMSDLRARGQGPAFLRLSARTIRYRPEDVLAYEEAQRFYNTAAGLASDFKAPAISETAAAPIEASRKRISRSVKGKNALDVKNSTGSVSPTGCEPEM
jgi:hypothetical protein